MDPTVDQSIVSDASANDPILVVDGALPCYCDTLRAFGGSYYGGSTLVLLSLFGPHNAVRAAWADLFKATRRKYVNGIRIGGQEVKRDNDLAYVSSSASLGRGLLHLVVFDPRLGHLAPAEEFFLQAGPNADELYFDRLSRWCPIPFRASWRARLWELGRAAGAITLLPGHGREVWRVTTTREVWEPIVTTAITDGSLN